MTTTKDFIKATIATKRENNTFNLNVNEGYHISTLLNHPKFKAYEPKEELINNMAKKKGLDLEQHKTLIKVLVYCNNLNKGHTFFYKGVSIELGYLEANESLKTPREFKEFQINSFIFVYDRKTHTKRAKNSSEEVVKNV